MKKFNFDKEFDWNVFFSGSWVKWLSVSTLIIGGASYVGYLFTPDWREIVDSKHYYSNWKVRNNFFLENFENFYVDFCLKLFFIIL